MKFYTRLNIYKDSTGNNYFDPIERKALSYKWWCYLKVIKGKLVFNNYRYSRTTTKHQRNLLTLLEELKIKIDLTVEIPAGLQNMSTIKEVRTAHANWLIAEEGIKNQKRLIRNERARIIRKERKEEGYTKKEQLEILSAFFQ